MRWTIDCLDNEAKKVFEFLKRTLKNKDIGQITVAPATDGSNAVVLLSVLPSALHPDEQYHPLVPWEELETTLYRKYGRDGVKIVKEA